MEQDDEVQVAAGEGEPVRGSVGVARWTAVATAVGGAVAMASLGFGATRGRKRSEGVRRRLCGKEKGAAAVAHFIGH